MVSLNNWHMRATSSGPPGSVLIEVSFFYFTPGVIVRLYTSGNYKAIRSFNAISRKIFASPEELVCFPYKLRRNMTLIRAFILTFAKIFKQMYVTQPKQHIPTCVLY